ncbi:hypothetical protein [Lacisediminihabitans sp.]|uniref:hypothetical protein n=1 Tax=Lacisediminihabitans sp. TaxID=2787631 RepID=UPI002F930C5F
MPVLDLSAVEAGFVTAGLPAELVTELLAAFSEAKRRFYLGDFRPQSVEGGRFSEAALRVLQWITTGAYKALSDPQFKADQVINALSQLPSGSFPESVRLHLPRAIRVIYDIRNKRNTAHLSDGIDPNTQDATIVVATMDWILAELVRLHHNVSASEAQAIIEALVAREVPMIQIFNGLPRILTNLPHTDHVLVLLYWHGDRPLDRATLRSWVPANVRTHLARTLTNLHDRFLVTADSNVVEITRKGLLEVESRRLIQPL